MKFESLSDVSDTIESLKQAIEALNGQIVYGSDAAPLTEEQVSNNVDIVNTRLDREAELKDLQGWHDYCDNYPEGFVDELFTENEGDIETVVNYLEQGEFSMYESVEDYVEQYLEGHYDEIPAIVRCHIDAEGLGHDLLQSEQGYGFYNDLLIIRYN